MGLFDELNNKKLATEALGQTTKLVIDIDALLSPDVVTLYINIT